MREKDVSAKSSAYSVRQYKRSQLKANIKKESLHLASSLHYTFKCNEPSILSYLFVLFFRAAAFPDLFVLPIVRSHLIYIIVKPV